MPKTERIDLICSVYNISKKWLLTGEGDMMDGRNKDYEFIIEKMRNGSIFVESIMEQIDKMNKYDRCTIEQTILMLSNEVSKSMSRRRFIVSPKNENGENENC